MPRYETFTYEETFSKNSRKKVPASLLIKGQKDPEILIILRLLSGSLQLNHNYSGTSIVSRTNYFTNNGKSFETKWKKKFPKLIAEDMKAKDLAVYIDATKYINKAFYKNILTEISQFILQTERGSHTSSFIFIYRLLEKISYAFPLIYASKSQDFVQSFTLLKELMVGDKEKKELGFFKKFVENLYQNEGIAETSVDIKISAVSPDVESQVFRTMKQVCDKDIIHEDTTEPRKLSIKYCDMGSFIITIRNRFFHNLNGGPTNIKSAEVIDSDLFFSFINPLAMRWLAMVFMEVVTHNISEFQKIKQTVA